MEALILFDYKNYTFSCSDCSWFGDESELDVVSKIDMNLVCCPLCLSDDVRVFNQQKLS